MDKVPYETVRRFVKDEDNARMVLPLIIRHSEEAQEMDTSRSLGASAVRCGGHRPQGHRHPEVKVTDIYVNICSY
jgi:hypothetical protein